MRYSSNIYNSKSERKMMFQVTQFVIFCYSADVNLRQNYHDEWHSLTFCFVSFFECRKGETKVRIKK